MTGKPTRNLTKRSLPIEVRSAVKAGQEKKGEDIVVLDLRGLSSFTDFFVIMTGHSARQNVAMGDQIRVELKKKNLRPLGVEKGAKADWFLMDYGFFIVHIFTPASREYYALEKLWGDASRLAYPS